MRKQTGVVVVETTALWHNLFPNEMLELMTRQHFEVCTTWPQLVQPDGLPDGVVLTQEYAWHLRPDDPVKVATDVIWNDYCIQHDLPPDTPYRVRHTGEWAGVEIDVTKTPRDLRLVAPEWWQKDFEANIWLIFERA